VPFPEAGVWRLRFNSDRLMYDPGFNGTPDMDVLAAVDGQALLTIGPYAALIFSQQP